MNREPLVTVASITAAVTAVLGLLVAFGFDLTSEKQAAILGVVAVAAPLLVAAVTRSKVTPVADPRLDGRPSLFDDRGAVTLTDVVLVLVGLAALLWLLDALRVLNLG